VPSLLQEFATLVEQGSMVEALRELQPNYEAQARVFAAIFAEKGLITSTSVQSRMLLTVARNLGADDSGYTSPQALVSSYRRGLQRLDEALAAAPYLLENYLLNEMFMMLFPFGDSSPFDCYLQLVSRFGLLRLILAARCNVDGDVPGSAVLVDTVHDYCRRFQHDKLFSRRVNGSLHDSGWASLDRLYGYLRT
jgi:lysine-N-methylase